MCLSFYHKYEKEIKDGYQFCEKCGKARKVRCNHRWEEFNRIWKTPVFISSYWIIICRCKNCGNLKIYKLK
jgi:hypothetical protein